MARGPYYIFHPDQRVREFEGKQPPYLEVGGEWIVKEVKDYRDCCDCKRSSFMGHSPQCICKVWNLDSGHHQRVTLTTSDGKNRDYSGAWLQPFIDSCRWTDEQNQRFLALLDELEPSKRVSYALRFDRFPLEIIVIVNDERAAIFTEAVLEHLAILATGLSGCAEPLVILNYQLHAAARARVIASGRQPDPFE